MSEYRAMEELVKALRAKAAGQRAPDGTPWGDWICDKAADILERQSADAVDKANAWDAIAEKNAALTTARDDALEEAAKVAETPDIWKQYEGDFEANCVAAAIRALKGSKP